MKVYVAAAGVEIERAEHAIAALRKAGVDVTRDWTIDVRESMRLGRPDSELGDEAAREFAHSDLEGVAAADCFWFLVPTSGGTGCFVELGVALGLGWTEDGPGGPARIVASGEKLGGIFVRLADYRFPEDEQALAWIVGQAKLWRGNP